MPRAFTATMRYDILVDARNRSCPGPLIALVQAVRRAEPGDVVLLLATDPEAPDDVKEWAEALGHRVLKVNVKEGVYEIYVEVSGE